MNRAGRHEIPVSEIPNCLYVLHRDAFIILGSTGVDFAVGGADGGEGRVDPFGGLGGDGIEVGIEEKRRKRRVRARPCEEKQGLSW